MLISQEPLRLCETVSFTLRSGNWILDNFPQTREQFNLMVERGLLPNNLICLKDNSDGGSFLLKRWYKLRTGQYQDALPVAIVNKFVKGVSKKNQLC